jgi:hypothetical protein
MGMRTQAAGVPAVALSGLVDASVDTTTLSAMSYLLADVASRAVTKECAVWTKVCWWSTRFSISAPNRSRATLNEPAM